MTKIVTEHGERWINPNLVTHLSSGTESYKGNTRFVTYIHFAGGESVIVRAVVDEVAEQISKGGGTMSS